MTNQSELEQDLQEVLVKKIKVIGEQQHSYYGYPIELIGLLADFITADRKRVALEARVDELKQLTEFEVATIGIIHGRHHRSYCDRIAELKAQQEET